MALIWDAVVAPLVLIDIRGIQLLPLYWTLIYSYHHSPILTLAPQRVMVAQSIKCLFAAVTTHAFDILLAAALPRDHAQHCIGMAVTNATVQRAHRVAVTGCGTKERQIKGKE